ncbi:hypothetical protein [Sorangium sp. So ce1078]|uniref:hypothetical protein n=1 Tax=Sorangium sp. So ce1078 TaxID=3133329 RepID=UPI003F5E2005
MKNRIFLHGLNLAIVGVAVAAFAACGDDDGGGSGGAGGTGGAGSASSTTTSSATTGSGTPASSSTGDAAATSTSAGTGGSDVVVPENLESVDDMEDGDNAIDDAGGRLGYWYSFNDGTGTQTPAVSTEEAPVEFLPEALTPAREQSTKAVHTSGSGFTMWGAGVGFDFSSAETGKEAYDASAYTGLVFWAKLGNADAVKSVKVMISDRSTTPEGGICVEGDEAAQCHDNWAKTVTLSDEWQAFVIPFEDLKQGGWGAPPATETIDTAAIYSLQFQTDKGTEFDYYIDDISFITAQ